ncbi:hypothetical protein CDV31_006904 [Fusarium ambrosium]|uniref:Uncharacterized protein n=1 Tax=Fusarium ambrosium TaxID=131363 RepID=A0A428UA90_9HYPO|nr:hypothetical protein CDV31_006904 [Fusarium ambrosium]
MEYRNSTAQHNTARNRTAHAQHVRMCELELWLCLAVLGAGGGGIGQSSVEAQGPGVGMEEEGSVRERVCRSISG